MERGVSRDCSAVARGASKARASGPRPTASALHRLAPFVALLAASCSAGTWEDDPKNWSRAFHEDRPGDGIEDVRSWYMRTPHFTAEFAWFFELRVTPEVKRGIAEAEGFQRLVDLTDGEYAKHLFEPVPAWFTPGPLAQYDVYQSDESLSFIILVEKDGERSFWCAMQL